MQIQSTTINTDIHSKLTSKKNIKQISEQQQNNTTIKYSTTPYYHPVNFGRIFNPTEEIKKEKELKESLLNQFIIEQKDPEGNILRNNHGQPIKKLDPKIKHMLDSKTFDFTAPDGTQMNCTVEEAIKAYIVETFDEDKKYNDLLHGTSTESIEDILTNGIDMSKTQRNAFGPGMYFAFSEGDANDYSSSKIIADITPQQRNSNQKGRIVRFNNNFYDQINTYQTYTAIQDFIDLKRPINAEQSYYIENVYREIPSKLFDEYVRELLVDDMGIDAAQCYASYHHPCVVVFNPDAITNIRKFKTSHSNSYYRY